MVDSSGTLSFWKDLLSFLAILLSFLATLLSFWQLYLSFLYFFIYFHPNPWFYLLFRLFHGKKMSFFIPKGEKSSGRLSFLLKYFKNPPVHWVFLKNWAWVFLKLEFFRLEFFSKCPKKSLVYNTFLNKTTFQSEALKLDFPVKLYNFYICVINQRNIRFKTRSLSPQ